MDFQFSLLENGLDFVLSSLEHLTAASAQPGASTSNIGVAATPQGQKRHLKYALIHLCSGIELIFKERLRQEDWQLVFQDPQKADEQAYASGDFKSVNFKEAQERLEEDCAVELTIKQKADLKSFRDRRNKIEHFGAVDSLLAVQASITQMVNFLLDFVEEAFEEDGLEDEEALLSEIRAKLGSCSAIVSDRWALIQAEVNKKYSTVTCPSCRQEAMSADGGTVKCLFCNYSTSSKAAADEYLANVLGYTSRYEMEKDGGEWPLRICPDCGSETYVSEVPGIFDTHDGYCFTCGQEYQAGELEECYDCGELYDPGEEKGHHICTDCFQAKVNRDD
jgi:hypothetical protein